MRSIDGSYDKDIKFLLFEHFSEIILFISSTLLMEILKKALAYGVISCCFWFTQFFQEVIVMFHPF